MPTTIRSCDNAHRLRRFQFPNDKCITNRNTGRGLLRGIINYIGQIKYLKHNWTVKNFSHCYQEYLENYVNLPNSDLTWSIKIYPKGNGENNKVILTINNFNLKYLLGLCVPLLEQSSREQCEEQQNWL